MSVTGAGGVYAAAVGDGAGCDCIECLRCICCSCGDGWAADGAGESDKSGPRLARIDPRRDSGCIDWPSSSSSSSSIAISPFSGGEAVLSLRALLFSFSRRFSSPSMRFSSSSSTSVLGPRFLGTASRQRSAGAGRAAAGAGAGAHGHAP